MSEYKIKDLEKALNKYEKDKQKKNSVALAVAVALYLLPILAIWFFCYLVWNGLI